MEKPVASAEASDSDIISGAASGMSPLLISSEPSKSASAVPAQSAA